MGSEALLVRTVAADGRWIALHSIWRISVAAADPIENSLTTTYEPDAMNGCLHPSP